MVLKEKKSLHALMQNYEGSVITRVLAACRNIHSVGKTQFQRAPEKKKSNIARSLNLLTFTFLQPDFVRCKTKQK